MVVMNDGFSTTITMSGNSSVLLYEKEVVPPGVVGGGPNETTTHRNTAWRTFSPKQLKTVGNSSAVVAYDPDAYEEVMALVNVEQIITIDFPDSSHLLFFGCVQDFILNPMQEGVQPTGVLEIASTNVNGAGNEHTPVLVSEGYSFGVYGVGVYPG